ncbi:MAG: PAS domain S-box protein [Bacteroidales bacterium]|nr:PAS domain S-box protein [Bacteroidales bacterium]
MHNQSEEKNSESMFIPNSADFVGQGMLLSNETWEHVIDASQGLIALITPDFRIQKINKALASYLGGSPSQFEGKPCYQVLHGNQQPNPDCPFMKFDGKPGVISSIVEDKVFGKSLVKAIPMLEADGKLTGCLHVIEPLDGSMSDARQADVERSMYSMVNAMPNPTVMCDTAGKILYASTGFLSLTGITDPIAVPGSNFISFLVHEDIEKAWLDFNAVCMGSRKKAEGQFLVRRAKRDSIKVEIVMMPVLNGGQSINNVMISFRDISGEMDLEESANKNHIRLSRFNKTFLGFSPEPALNINRLITLLGEMLGASSSSFTRIENGKITPFASWQSPFMQDFTPEITDNIVYRQYLDTREDLIYLSRPQLASSLLEYPELHEQFGIKSMLGITVKTGNAITGLISVVFTFNYQLRSDDREFCSMISSALALEGSRAATTKTAEVNDLNYRELFDFFTDSIYIIDPDGAFIDVNTGATRMYGYNREEMIGRTPEMLSAPGKNDPVQMAESLKKAFNGDAQVLEWWGIRKNGEVFPKDIVLNRGRYFGRDVVIAIGRDITERKLVEQKLLEYNLELKETNQSKDKFFSILAHDLKNPFGGLLGFIDLLYEDIDELSTDQVKEYLQNIRTASYHTYSLLENLLEWSRIQTGKVAFRPSKFDLREEVESVLMVLEANSIRKNIKLVNQIEPGVVAEADRNMIHSVIQNLTTNAIKFSNSSSSVIISGKVLPSAADSLAVTDSIDKPRRWFELSVSDTGIGIPEEIMPRLFKLDGQFSMAGTANEPGTGLGLILCKEMVEKNGGKIRVESIQNNGSTFIFTLPLSE